MTNHLIHSDQVWSLILAGGEGKRLQPWVQRLWGHTLPKQYCTFMGSRSMFQHTLDRADLLGHPERKVTVIAPHHRQVACRQIGNRLGKVIVQPDNRDTAVGIFLALVYIRAWDPHATVVIYPSDHFVYPESAFMDIVKRATLAAQHLEDRLILLGALPDCAELDYGWIKPGPKLDLEGAYGLQTVVTFLEKPNLRVAQAAQATGWLWNTLVLIGKVGTLWKLGWHCLPELLARFHQLEEAIDTSYEKAVLKLAYRAMPAKNFSRDLLSRVPHQLALMKLDNLWWSDWGNPDRIIETIRKLGERSAFSLEPLMTGTSTNDGRFACGDKSSGTVYPSLRR